MIHDKNDQFVNANGWIAVVLVIPFAAESRMKNWRRLSASMRSPIALSVILCWDALAWNSAIPADAELGLILILLILRMIW